jgi:hypothetical protein
MKQPGTNGSLPQAYANQIDYCRASDATIAARVVTALAHLLDNPDAGAFIARIRDWPGAPLAAAHARGAWIDWRADQG